MAKLKVFRTAAGFYDAYVAAPSQKAALEAWGSDANLFARGVAEQVTDAKLMKAPLASPGEVIRISRGSAADQIAALPKAKRKEAGKAATAKPKHISPKPSRAKVEAAEKAIERAEAKQEAEREALARQIEAMERKRRALEARQEAALSKLHNRLDEAREAYSEALADWKG